MTVSLNHTVISSHDREATADFFTTILGLQAYSMAGHFAVVQVGETSLDFVTTDSDIASRHFAFLVSEAEFDEIFSRIGKAQLLYWSDPGRKKSGQINHWDDGRGVYFDDPNGHLLEVITRPYGSAGPDAENPHPLLSPKS